MPQNPVSSRVVRINRIGSDLSGSTRNWWATFECLDRRTNEVFNFAAYGSNAYRLVNYMAAGNYYTVEYVADDASDGEIISASFIP